MKPRMQVLAWSTVFCLVLGGCAKTQDAAAEQAAAEQKLAEAQQQVAKAEEDLAKAREKAATGGEAAGTPAGGQAVAGGGRAAAGSGWGQGGGSAAQPRAAVPAAPKTYTVPAGTPVSVRTVSAISTKTATDGAPFEATLHQPLEVDGYTVAAKGATVKGIVAQSDPGGRVKGVASLTVSLQSIETAGGEVVKIDTTNYTKLAPKSTKKDALKVGIGAGIGAAIGAIAGGGKGAAIGAGAGGAAGTGAVVATRGDPAVLPSESLITFKLQAPVTVTAGK
ncbi:MAG: hypothetical protein IH602_23105 [Bryobacteraceae bacterium]|nr:hypothetical protein [Bryobacteraceae bacterium]